MAATTQVRLLVRTVLHTADAYRGTQPKRPPAAGEQRHRPNVQLLRAQCRHQFRIMDLFCIVIMDCASCAPPVPSIACAAFIRLMVRYVRQAGGRGLAIATRATADSAGPAAFIVDGCLLGQGLLRMHWPCGLMDKALVFGTKDCRFESCRGHFVSWRYNPNCPHNCGGPP